LVSVVVDDRGVGKSKRFSISLRTPGAIADRRLLEFKLEKSFWEAKEEGRSSAAFNKLLASFILFDASGPEITEFDL